MSRGRTGRSGTSGSRLRFPAFGAGLLALALAAPAPAGAAPALQPLVMLTRDHVARNAPSAQADRLAIVEDRRPLTRVRTVLPVLGRAADAADEDWVRVLLPGRPNGRTGWISTAHTLPASTPWRLSVDLSSRRVTVRFLGRVVRRFPAIVGASATPTPRGRFFVEEALSLSSSAAGGPYALATSAHSEVLQEFEGGPGQVALHGINNLSGVMGTAVSHGCVRVGTNAITWLSRRIGAGVPLNIVS